MKTWLKSSLTTGVVIFSLSILLVLIIIIWGNAGAVHGLALLFVIRVGVALTILSFIVGGVSVPILRLIKKKPTQSC